MTQNDFAATTWELFDQDEEHTGEKLTAVNLLWSRGSRRRGCIQFTLSRGYLQLASAGPPTGQPGRPWSFLHRGSDWRWGVGGQRPPRGLRSGSRESPEVEEHLAQRSGQACGGWQALRETGPHAHGCPRLVLERQNEGHGLGRIQPLGLPWPGCLPSAGVALPLEGGHQDLLGLGAQDTRSTTPGLCFILYTWHQRVFQAESSFQLCQFFPKCFRTHKLYFGSSNI